MAQRVKNLPTTNQSKDMYKLILKEYKCQDDNCIYHKIKEDIK